MQWVAPEYNKDEINWAGDTLISENKPEEELRRATAIIDNWRASHSYPMHVFKMRLKDCAQLIDQDAVVVQRLKRVPAIKYKLKRRYRPDTPLLTLYEIQDIGGCRAVMNTVTSAKKLFEENYLKGELKHKRIRVNDYVTYPKKDGYRSFHIIYAYKSDKRNKKAFNGLLVEIQIRSKLQHLWATAVETVGLFTGQALKTNEGEEDWKAFFKLVSSAFAMMENSPIIPGTITNEKELFMEIKQRERDLGVIAKMKGWQKAMSSMSHIEQNKAHLKYFLLKLDLLAERLELIGYQEKDEKKALAEYASEETKNQGNKQFDVVLVGADNAIELKKAYPNYFVDTDDFLVRLKRIVDKY